MTDPKKKKTQKDVARLAGVSQAIVSHVVNQTEKAIPEETRVRVQQAMAELGYTPNKAARSLRSQKAYAIACLVPDITNPFFPAFLRGIQEVADDQDHDLIIYDAHMRGDQETRYLRALAGAQVDGAILVLHHTDGSLVERLLDAGLHIVTLEPGKPEAGTLRYDTVYVDNHSAAKAAVNYLIDRGHTQIGILAGTEGTPPQRSRLAGYRSALTERGLPFNQALVRNGDFTEGSGYREMMALFAVDPVPTAVFAATDRIAVGAMRAVQESGLDVPGDVAVLGFDDIPAARLVHPSLTTVTQFQENIGRRAAQLLFDRLNGSVGEPIRSLEMPFEIIVRESA